MNRPSRSLAASSAVSILFCLPAFAAGDPASELEEVVVSATLRAEPLDRVASSVTVLDAAALDRPGAEHFGDVLGALPNVNFSGGTSRPRFFQIRGIGELEEYEGAPNPSVGFLIDDVDFSGIAMPAGLFDAERVEVLRGPQGTAYGANALAGLVNLRTRAPVDRFEGLASVEAGDYGWRGAGLVLNDTLGEDSAYRIAVHRFKSDGYRENAYLHRDDTNGFDETMLRGKLRTRLGDDLTANLMALYADADNGYDAWSNDNTRITQSDQPGRDAQRSRALALRLDYTGLPGADLHSITTLAHSDVDYSFDGDWGNDTYWGIYAPYQFFEEITRLRRTASQELRLVSRDDAARVRWVAGLYGLRLTEAYALTDTYNGELYRHIDSDYTATNLAAYAQVDVTLAPRWNLSVGVRGERRDASYADSNALRLDPTDDMLGGHLSLTFHAAEGRDLYASLTRGYKAGGINTGSDVPARLRTYDPEFLWNLEAGLRTRSADGRFDSQTSVFYMRRIDEQVSSSYQSDPSDPLTFLLFTDNAARGRNYGVETQVGWRPVRSLRLGATAGLLRAQFLDYVVAGRSLDGRAQPHAPAYQFGLTADVDFAGGFFAHADATAVDAFYFSASHDQKSDPYQLVNVKAGWRNDRWTATVWARNLFDERYAVRGFYFGNEPPDFLDKRYVQNGDPRQVGASVAVSF